MSLNKQKIPRKSSNRILQQKQVTLLLNSQAIDEFSWLKTLLQEKVDEGRPFLTSKDESNIPDDQRQFLQNSLDDLEKVSTNEWKCETNDIQGDGGDNKDDWVHCALCDTRNRWVFYIINTVNGIRLNVGSTCITHFGFNTSGISISQLKKEATKVRWANEIDQRIPDIKHLATGWNDHLNSYPILIPDSYDEKFRELGKQFRTCFENYVDPKSNHAAEDLERTVQELKRLLEESEDLKGLMAAYSKAHETDEFVVTRDVVRWLPRLGTEKTRLIIKLLKKDGHITALTAHRIAEPGFMQSIVPNLNDQLRNDGLKVRRIDNSRPGYILATTEIPVIQLVISHRDLLMALGESMFEKRENAGLSEVIKHCAIANDASREIVRAKFAKDLEAHGFSQHSLAGKFESIREEFDEWVLFELSTQRLIIVENLSKILDRYVAGTMAGEEFVRNYLASRVPRYSVDDFQELYSSRTRNG
ncbi:MAG: hypothetical protein ACYC57_08210 [Thermoleophilia bacterium]